MKDNDKVQDHDGERNDWFVTAAAAVGDLSNPFYREERQRDVWNEASAIGFQLMLILGLAAAAGMLWFGGEPAMPYALTLLGVIGFSSLVTIGYAARLGVDAEEPERMLRLRMVPYLALLVLVIVGVVRAAPSSSFGAGLAWGAAIGAAVSVIAVLQKWLRNRNQAPDTSA